LEAMDTVTGAEGRLKTFEDKIENFKDYKARELLKVDDSEDLTHKKRNLDRVDKEIQAAIEKTGQTEENVAKFLKMTYGMINATMQTTADANKMSSQIKTFDELINRECTDKLSIRQYAYEDECMRPFIAIFESHDMDKMRSLKCRTEEEFEDMVSMIEADLAKKQEDELGADNDDADVEAVSSEIVEETKEEDLSAESLLEKWGFSKFWEKLEEEGWTDPQDWPDMSDEDLKDVGIKGGFRKRWKRHMKELRAGGQITALLTSQQMGFLREICLKPETWQEIEADQAQAAKDGMGAISILMGDFFNNLHAGVKDACRILEYKEPPTSQQLKAIELIKQTASKPETGDDDEKESIEVRALENIGDSAAEQREKWKAGSECEVYSSTLNKWCNAKIVAIHNDGGDWVQVEYEGTSAETGSTKELERCSEMLRPRGYAEKMVRVHNKALREAATSRLCVTDQMMERFNEDSQTNRALTVAGGLEDCCKQMMSSHATVRESLLLAQAIWKMKPANMENDKCKALWEVVDDGAVRLMKSAVNMAKACADFFGYFRRFQHSFQYFSSNKDKSLAVSLGSLRKDCRNFSSFQEKFMKEVDKLHKEAMQVIINCVKQQGGSDAFESAKNSRKELQRIYLEAKEKYDQKEIELDAECSSLKVERANCCQEKEMAEAEVAELESTIKRNERFLADYNRILGKMEERIF